MKAISRRDGKARVGDIFPTLELTAASGQRVTIHDPGGGHVHLQLRRFAGCPICNLHPRSIVNRHDEIRSGGIWEVVVFHSTAKELAKHKGEMPFPLIPNPGRALYRQLGVEREPSSLLSGGALRAAMAGPADFLIARDGRIAAVKYGKHAYDPADRRRRPRAGPRPAAVARASGVKRARCSRSSSSHSPRPCPAP